MSSSSDSSKSIRVMLSGRASAVNSIQEITLRATLNRALDLVGGCFDNFNRKVEPDSVFSRQSVECDEKYTTGENHKTSLYHTEGLAKNLVHSGLDYLLGASEAVLGIGSGVRWTAMSLTRSLIEASAECLWLIDPNLDLDSRLRRTNQVLVRDCEDVIRILPEPEDRIRRFLSINSSIKGQLIEQRDSVLQWAKAQAGSAQMANQLRVGIGPRKFQVTKRW